MFSKYAFEKNVYIRWHALGGALIAAVVYLYSNEATAMGMVVGASLLWEVLEYVSLAFRGGLRKVYGNTEITAGRHFTLDAFGDVLAAVLSALFVLLLIPLIV